ncbi:MAG TPA: hypothetical protein VF038_10130 [Usitatibacter sp.]|jgi:hypothetical protein
MNEMNVLLEPVRASLYQVGEFLPRVLLAAAILVAGWLIAKALRFAIAKALRGLNFHVIAEKAGIDTFLRQGGGEVDTIGLLAGLAYWLVILAALMIAFNSLGLAYVTELIGRVVLFVPRVMVAVLIVAFGAYFARFVGAAVATYFRNIGMGDATILGAIAFYAILVFVVLIALDQLGLGDIIRETFLILVAAFAFALALAFGLGGQKRAAELIESWSRREGDGEGEEGRKPPPPVI